MGIFPPPALIILILTPYLEGNMTPSSALAPLSPWWWRQPLRP